MAGTQTLRPCNKGRTTPQSRPRCHSNDSDPGYLASDSSDHESPPEEDEKRSLFTRNTNSPERHFSRPQSLSDTSDSDSYESCHYNSGELSKTQLTSPQTPSQVQAGEPAIIARDVEQYKRLSRTLNYTPIIFILFTLFCLLLHTLFLSFLY